ncbi:hypothetical protein CcaverHIS002_0310770 [Cutaneotrichosporon cavernicola]|nr:hypothetical protein CcaverHIS002_0310770 [Cutaneotrichosporon cavernicola]
MNIDAPVSRQRRRVGPGGRMGVMWIASWNVLAPGQGEPVAAKVKLWDECAREWGGIVRKGDVILLEDYVFRAGPRGAVSSGERGKINAEDQALRPGLRLARSDRGVQAVAEMARWCADWVGGEGP